MKYLMLPFLLFFVFNARAQTTYYVKAGGSGSGTSWADAMPDLATAVSAAGPGDRIFVAAGIYPNTSLDLTKDVKIYGSFAGTEASLEERDLSAGDTSILQGDGSGTVIRSSGLTSAAVLDGFKITGGVTEYDGGGMYNDGSSPTISHCTFSGNSTVFYGGGISNVNASSPAISYCAFSGNSADSGGGISNTSGSSPAITHCIFSGNSANMFGGGIYNYNSSPAIAYCTFLGNGSAGSGGGMFNGGSSPSITHCSFQGNNSADGGGISNQGSSSPVVSNCLFSGNRVDYGGGAIFNANFSSPVISNCTLSGNRAGDVGDYSSVIFNNSYCRPVIANCIIYGNSGGIDNINNSMPEITYSLVQGINTGATNLDGNTVDPQFLDDDDYIWEDAPFTGNDYHLKVSSPVINAGIKDSIPAGITDDLDGQARIYDAAGGGEVDLGAYEYQGIQVGPGAGGILYVNAAAGPNGNGASWEEALQQLYTALHAADSINQNAASSADSVKQIWVAKGTYRPVAGGSGGSFTMLQNVKIYGSFAGDETSLEERTLAPADVSILQGDGSHHVIYNNNNGLTATAVLGWFKITGGGSGIYNYNSSPALTHCTFSGNSSDFGGGMSNNQGSSPRLTDCTFSGNSAGLGGGMYNQGSSPTITRCTFSGNSAGLGGGMGNENSSPVLTSCVFSGNSSTNGGGMHNSDGSSPRLTNCTFSGNNSSAGGGMYNFNNSSPVLVNCIVYGNSSGIDAGDGIIKITYSLVQGIDTGATNLNGNTIDPGFVNDDDYSYSDAPFTGNDYHIASAGSPVIDAGNNDAIAPGIITDLDGNLRIDHGTIDLGAYEANTADDPPILTGGGSAAYTENGAAMPVNTGITITDDGNSAITSDSVTITSGYKPPEDTLMFVNDDPAVFGNITASFDAAKGKLTLTSSPDDPATPAQWQRALRAVTYYNHSDDPDNGDRTIGFEVVDGAGVSNTVSATIAVTDVNDAPVITTASPALTGITEDAAGNGGQPVSSFAGSSITDADAGALAGIAVVDTTTGNGTWQYSLDDGATWSNISAVSEDNALLLRSTDKIRFVPDGKNGTEAAITYRAWDQSGTTAGKAGTGADAAANGGTTAFSSVTDAASITVTDVNDAPVLTTASPALTGITEDAAGNGGQRVSSFAGSSITDIDAGALAGIAVVDTTTGNGAWQYSLDDGATWSDISAVSEDNALLLRSTDKIRFVPDGKNGTEAAITYRAWDQSGTTAGKAGMGADAAANGGTTAFSSATDVASITITDVNDAPVITLDGGGATASTDVAENTTAVATVTATDADAGTTLIYSLSDGADKDKFSIDGTTGALTFTAAPNFESPGDADADNAYEVTVEVSDGAKTDGQAITVTVTNENDNTPVITSNSGGATASIDVAENTTAVTTVKAADADAGTTLTYSLNGGADAGKFSIDASTGDLTFKTVPDYESATDAGTNNTYEVTVQASDGTKTISQELTVTVTDVNDLTPVITPSQSFTVDENSATKTVAGVVKATDGDVTGTAYRDWKITAGNTNGAFVIDPSSGQITVNNGPLLDYETKPLYTLTLTVSDGKNTSAPQTVTIQLNDQAEAPTAVSLTPVTLYENQPAGTPAGRLSSVAQNAGATFTYTLAAGAGDADNSLFTVSGDALSTKASFNYEQKNSYSIRVRAATRYGQSLEKAFIINISDVNETPSLDAIADQAICYTTEQQSISLSGISAGEDVGQTPILSVTSDNPALFESLTVSGNKLKYRLNSSGGANGGEATVTVTVRDNGGTANGGINSVSQLFNLKVSAPPSVTITSDMGTTLSKGATAHLTATGGTAYQWTAADGIAGGPGSAVLTVRPAQDATYHVIVTNTEGCSAGGAIALTVKEDYAALSAHNIFTPNGDGKNDTWKIANLDLYPENEVFIYDRSGRLIFHKKNYRNGWNGTVNGCPLHTGTYYYVVNVESGKKIFKGFITILRDR